MQPDSNKKTIFVALVLCLVCSFLVSASAIGLKSRQQRNRELDRKKNILVAAGLYDPEQDNINDVPQKFKRIQPVLVDLVSGKLADSSLLEKLGGEKFDQKKAINNPKQSTVLAPEIDIAGIKRRENYAWLYQVRSATGNEVEQYVLPIRGKGLWSTLWGFVSLDADLKTIRGLTFYKHAETPGLGGEIDSKKFKSAWRGKLAFNKAWKIQIALPKQLSSDEELAKHQVEAIPGATITSRGVQETLRFWLGEHGFGKYLEAMRNEKNLTHHLHSTPVKEGTHG